MSSPYEALNLLQEKSEHDPFTVGRYCQFFRYFPDSACSILDVGCNTGRGGQTFKALNENLRITGLDIVQSRLDRLPMQVYEAGIQGPSTKIPAEDCAFDVVVAGEFIEHLYPHDVDATLAEIFRVLKIGGRLLLTTPNPQDIKRRIRGATMLGGAHLSQHFPSMLKLRLKMLGFSHVRIRGSGRVSIYLGCHMPLRLYGSYLAIGDKY